MTLSFEPWRCMVLSGQLFARLSLEVCPAGFFGTGRDGIWPGIGIPSRDPPSRDERDSICTYISYLTTYSLRLRIYVPHLFPLKIAYPDQDSRPVIPSRIVPSRRVSSRDFPDPGKIHGTEPGHTSSCFAFDLE